MNIHWLLLKWKYRFSLPKFRLLSAFQMYLVIKTVAKKSCLILWSASLWIAHSDKRVDMQWRLKRFVKARNFVSEFSFKTCERNRNTETKLVSCVLFTKEKQKSCYIRILSARISRFLALARCHTSSPLFSTNEIMGYLEVKELLEGGSGYCRNDSET